MPLSYGMQYAVITEDDGETADGQFFIRDEAFIGRSYGFHLLPFDRTADLVGKQDRELVLLEFQLFFQRLPGSCGDAGNAHSLRQHQPTDDNTGDLEGQRPSRSFAAQQGTDFMEWKFHEFSPVLGY